MAFPLFTLTTAELLSDPELAVIVAVPTAAALTRPWVPAVLPTVAIVASEVLQLAVCVTSCFVPSVSVMVAVSCCVFPGFNELILGVTVKVAGVAGVNVNVVEPFTVPEVAVMVVVPTPTSVASPPLMVATAGFEELQVAFAVMSLMVPSLNEPVAVKT